MKTKQEILEQLKVENPTLRLGDDQTGYRILTPDEYEAAMLVHANDRFDLQMYNAELENARANAEAKLGAVGLTVEDLQVLGL